MWKKNPPTPKISMNSGPEKDPAFKKKAIFVLAVGAVIFLAIQAFKMMAPSPDEAAPAEQTSQTSPPESGAVDSGSAQIETPSYQSLPTPSVDVLNLQTEDRQPSRQDRDPLLAKIAPRLECTRFRSYVEDGYLTADPFTAAQRAVAVDILADIGCLDAARTTVQLRQMHPDIRLLKRGRGAAKHYGAVISTSSSQCRQLSRNLEVMSESAPFESIAEYFSRIDLTRCLVSKVDGNYQFTDGQWDVAPLQQRGVPPEAITEIRLLRAIRGCADFIYEITDATDSGLTGDALGAALASIRKRAYGAGCVTVNT